MSKDLFSVIRERLDDDGLPLTNLSDVEDREVDWLWLGWVPKGEGSLLTGDPDVGKTHFLLWLAAIVAQGGEFPDGTLCPQGRVLYVDGENGLDEIKRRLARLGFTAYSNVRVLSVRQPSGDFLELDLIRDAPRIEEAANSFQPDLIIIDPLVAFHQQNEIQAPQVRKLMNILACLAQKLNSALIAVQHPNKNEEQRSLYRVRGSLDFVAAARVVLKVEMVDEDKRLRRLAVEKMNIAGHPDGLVFTIDDMGVVRWLPEVEVSTKQAKGARDKAKAWLQEVLANGPVSATELQEKAVEAGHSWPTVRRAAKNMGIKPYKGTKDDPRWWYELPT